MARKGKEPAGLRRYRLAKKRKKSGVRKRRVVRAAPTKRRNRRVVSTVARRRRGYNRKKSRKKSKSVAVAPLLPVLAVTASAWSESGGALGGAGSFQNRLMKSVTGYDPVAKSFSVDNGKAFWFGELAAVVVHKVATKTGVNNYIRKATMGYITI